MWYKVLFCFDVFTKYHGTNMVFQNVLWYDILGITLEFCHYTTIQQQYVLYYYGVL